MAEKLKCDSCNKKGNYIFESDCKHYLCLFCTKIINTKALGKIYHCHILYGNGTAKLVKKNKKTAQSIIQSIRRYIKKIDKENISQLSAGSKAWITKLNGRIGDMNIGCIHPKYYDTIIENVFE